MALPEFRNEQEFRDNWIAPFLAKLGFMNIKNTHGPGEHGKDFFFTDYDRFGHSRYYAAQVKLGNIGSGGKEINDLLDQVKRCFGVRLRFHKGVHEQRISAVYVMTSGTISDYARQRIHDWCQSENYGENVYFLDGEQLENKERFAVYEDDKKRRQRFTALYNETRRNMGLLIRQVDSFDTAIPQFSIFRLTALQDELSQMPLYENLIPIAECLERIWFQLSNFNSFDLRLGVTLRKKDNPQVVALTKTLLQRMLDVSNDMKSVIDYCNGELQKLNERYSLIATPIEPNSEQ